MIIGIVLLGTVRGGRREHPRRHRLRGPRPESAAHLTRRLLFVHAHPDDETLATGGTIAHYAAEPDTEVTLVTCTLGEEGEVIGPDLQLLVTAEADQLGGYRMAERAAACAALGVTDHRYLGGAGRWRDSGMALAGYGVRATARRRCTRGRSRRRRRSTPRSRRWWRCSRRCGRRSSSATRRTAGTATPTTSARTRSRGGGGRGARAAALRRGRARHARRRARRRWATSRSGCPWPTSCPACPTRRSPPGWTCATSTPGGSRPCGRTPRRSSSRRTSGRSR